MVKGFQCRFGPHSIFSTKPMTVSMDGLRGTFVNSRPDTRVEIQSPEIRPGDRFLLDGKLIAVEKSGILNILLAAAEQHSFSRAQ
jgi:hypothetical protein